MMRALVSVVSIAAVVGCGGKTVTEVLDDGGSDASADGAADGATDAGGGLCPGAMPTGGTVCPRDGLVCEYGDDPRPACDAYAQCDSGTWTLVPAAPCAPIPTAKCPATIDEAKSLRSCDPEGVFCTYGAQTCVCSACLGGPCGTIPRFVCDEPPGDARCPTERPLLGRECSIEGLRCTYGTCGGGTAAGRVCTKGVWGDEPIACPL